MKRFFECLLPVSFCNLECPYCYIIQEERRDMQVPKLKYSPQHIAEALRPERVGGIAYISMCGAGETMIQSEIVELVKCILQKGHYVNITTNGTMTHRFDQLIDVCGPLIRHLHVSFSMHYTELVKKGLLDQFFDNIVKVRNAGASILLQMNLCDEYIPYIEEIKAVSMKRVGAYPQIALTRNEKTTPFSIYTKGTKDEYIEYGKQFRSPLFEFTVKNFNVKRKEFCFAGDWTGTLNLQTGILRKCYAEPHGVNILEDIDSPVPFEAIGYGCKSPYCINSSHFMSLGVIPSIKSPTYAQLRNREEAQWYTSEMTAFLNGKLHDSNGKFRSIKKYIVGRLKGATIREHLSKYKFYRALHRIKKKLQGQ